MSAQIDRLGVDTWLARHLLESQALSEELLVRSLTTARLRRGEGVTLARVLVSEGHVAEEALDQQLRALWGEELRWEPGADVDGYRLVRHLGSGGMGSVWEAEGHGRRCAIKALPRGADAEARLRFQREAEAQALVDRHPHVVGIHSAGTWAEQAYLVMDLVAGGDLELRLRAGRMEWRPALELARDLASGLAHVHERGVLHRDLKPANVLFDAGGRPLLVDFGLARIAEARTLTQSGSILGTPAYMSPEQATGAEVDARCDVYGLGAVLYHCLTGVPPVSGSTIQVLTAVVEGAITRPRQRVPELPPAVDALCMRLLATAPSARPASAELAAQELGAVLSEGGAPPTPTRSRAGWVLIGALAGGAATWAATAGRPRAPEAPAPRTDRESVAALQSRTTPPLARPWREGLQFMSASVQRDALRLATELLATPRPSVEDALLAREMLLIVRYGAPEADLSALTRTLLSLSHREGYQALLPSATGRPLLGARLRAALSEKGAGEATQLATKFGRRLSPLSRRVELLETLILVQPRCKRAWFELGRQLNHVGEHGSAVWALRRRRAMETTASMTPYLEGYALVSLGRYAEARLALERSLQEKRRERAHCLSLMAEVELREGHPQRALEFLEQAIVEPVRGGWDPRNAFRYWDLRAEVSRALGDLRGARGAEEEAAKANLF